VLLWDGAFSDLVSIVCRSISTYYQKVNGDIFVKCLSDPFIWKKLGIDADFGVKGRGILALRR